MGRLSTCLRLQGRCSEIAGVSDWGYCSIMDYEFKHYRRPPGADTGVLVAKFVISGDGVGAAIAASQQHADAMQPDSDFGILWDLRGNFVRHWGNKPG